MLVSGGIMPMTFVKKTLLSAAGMAFAVGLATPVIAQDADLVKKGQAVYSAQKCQTCHSIGGKGNKQNPLDGVGKKLSADEIRQWIVDPVGMTAKTKSTKKPPMPS